MSTYTQWERCLKCHHQFSSIVNDEIRKVDPYSCRTGFCLRCASRYWPHAAQEEKRQWIDIAGANPTILLSLSGEDIAYHDIRSRIDFECELERKALMAKARKERERARREYRATFGNWQPPHKRAPEPIARTSPPEIYLEIHRGYEIGVERDSAEKTPRRPELEPPPWEQALALAFEG